MNDLPENLRPLYDRLASIPVLPGCYLWKRFNKETQKVEVLYVGKAINLRNRIRSYFNMTDYKTRYLMAKVSDLDYVVTKNELEALLLENNLIKEYSPPYNIRLKDDKRYPYLCLTTGEPFPRLIITRRKTNPKHTYFGPYPDAGAARNIMALILKIFPIRKRKQTLPAKTPQRPCLNYHIGVCLAPCAEKISQQDYGIMIQKIKNFLEAKDANILPDLQNEMNNYAKEMDYEKAAVYRDIISDIKAIYSEQSVHEDIDESNFDVIGLAGMNQQEVDELLSVPGSGIDLDEPVKKEEDKIENKNYYAQIVLLRIRNGNLVNKGSYALSETIGETDGTVQNDDFNSELIETFLREYYLKLTEIPGTILINTLLNSQDQWQKFLTEKFHNEITIVSDESDQRMYEKKSLVQMAQNNARLTLRERILSEKIRNQRYGLKQIQNFLGMTKLPEMIECYDISNIQGTDAVGCGVTLKNGIPYKAGYRKYKITTKQTPDDPAMIYEVLSRRMRAFSEKTAQIPDLILIDGGITQLNAALRARTENKVNVKIVSLAKKEETIVTENNREIHMDKNSPGMLILRLARDEAHRFSVAYHRNLRSRRNLKSMLDDISGIGDVRKKRIMKVLTDLADKEPDKNDLMKSLSAIGGINQEQMEEVCKRFIV